MADTPDWLNSSFLERALRSAADGSSVTVTSSDVTRATAAGDNYVSDIYRTIVRMIRDGQPETTSLIVKSDSEREEMSKVNKYRLLFTHTLVIQCTLSDELFSSYFVK
jgi:hypothetical protein